MANLVERITPGNWNVQSNDGTTLVAKNNVTGEVFNGSLVDYNAIFKANYVEEATPRWVVDNKTKDLVGYRKADGSVQNIVQSFSTPGGGVVNSRRGIVTNSGGVVSSAARGREQELVDWLIPTHDVIMSPDALAGIAPIVDGTTTLSYAAGQGDFSSGSVRIVCSGATAIKLIDIPNPVMLENGLGSSDVLASGTVHTRFKISDPSAVKRLVVTFYQDAGKVKRKSFPIKVTSSKYGLADPAYSTAWENVYRTVSLASQNWTDNGFPDAWGLGAKDYPVHGVGIQIETTAAVTIDFDRIYSPKWPAGVIVTIADGCYNSAREYLRKDFLPRGWGAGASGNKIGEGGVSPYMSDLVAFADDGFDVFPHGADVSAEGLAQPMSAAVTAERYAKILAQKRAAFFKAGIPSTGGMQYHQWLQNSGIHAGSDMAGILRKAGVVAGRFAASDAQWGVNPAATTLTNSAFNEVASHLPYRGFFNHIAAPIHSNIAAGANYDAAATDPLVLTGRGRVAYAAETKGLATMYIHQVRNEVDLNNSTVACWDGYVDHLASEEAQGNLVMLSPSMLAKLTTQRDKNGLFMDWDGEWRYRGDSTKRIAF